MTRSNKIYIIDNNTEDVKQIKSILEGARLGEVRSFASGFEGIQACLESPPDCVILEVDLPSVRGEEICRILRSMDEFKNAPIVICTKSGHHEFHSGDLLAVGANDLIPKPVKEQSLIEVVKKLLSPAAGDEKTRIGEVSDSIVTEAHRIRGYRIISMIGGGGMGMVYMAEQLSLGRKVALKVLAPHIQQDKEMCMYFEREARILAQVSHPNVTQIYDFGKEGSLYYFAMEYVEGRNLGQCINNDDLTFDDKVKIVRQSCEALSHLHSKMIIHRDIKPANILLSINNEVKITDFGLSRANPLHDRTETVATKYFVGTPYYAAPEVLTGKPATELSDQYSLGVTLWCLFARESPKRCQTPLDEIRPELPFALSGALARCLNIKAEERFGSVREAGEAILAACLGSSPASHITPTDPNELTSILGHGNASQAATEADPSKYPTVLPGMQPHSNVPSGGRAAYSEAGAGSGHGGVSEFTTVTGPSTSYSVTDRGRPYMVWLILAVVVLVAALVGVVIWRQAELEKRLAEGGVSAAEKSTPTPTPQTTDIPPPTFAPRMTPMQQQPVVVAAPVPTSTPQPTVTPTASPTPRPSPSPTPPPRDIGPQVFINEIHYTNAGLETGEGIEICGPAGTILDGWKVIFYDSLLGKPARDPVDLEGTILNLKDGWGTIWFPMMGIQEKGPEGVALIGPEGNVVQFLSLADKFTATDELVKNQVAQPIGIKQTKETDGHLSLQLNGIGMGYNDFKWVLAPQSKNMVNPNQHFADPTKVDARYVEQNREKPKKYETSRGVFINEIHYHDEERPDHAEGIELAGPAQTDLQGWSICLYNGSSGLMYKSINASGIIPDLQNSFGVVWVPIPGIIDSEAGGIALIDPSLRVLQFLSYGGQIVAEDGPAKGMWSTDIEVVEPEGMRSTYSLQLHGIGFSEEHFIWHEQPQHETKGLINEDQTFGNP